MTAAWGQIAGAITLAVMLAFLGIWAWVWLPQHQRKFHELAALPMEDGKDGR